MKFPSIKTLLDGANAVISRFPLSIAFAMVGTIAAILNVGIVNPNDELSNWYWRTIMMADLGMLLTLAATLYCESKSWARANAYIIKTCATVVAVIFLFVLNPIKHEDDVSRFLLLSVGCHLLVAFAGFTGKDFINGFWQFNKTLFLRFLSGILYSSVLFIGLSAAIGALNLLFGFKFEWRTFSILWVIIVGLFNTFFVLAGLPADLDRLDDDQSYPRSLKIFTQYVLIPLITVYLVILLAYEVKICVEWSLPKGSVSSLILGYAVFGILSLLLVYPIRHEAENRWIKSFSKSFYFFMVPLLILLYLAVGTRVFKYGVTEERYFLIVLAFWLLGISIYFLTSKKQDIKLIPASLCLVVLLSIYGPQSALNISYTSQKNVIKKIFERNHALENNTLLRIDERKFSREDIKQVISAFSYVISGEDLPALQPYFKQDLKKVADSLDMGEDYNNRYLIKEKKIEWIKGQLGLTHFNNSGGYMGKDYNGDNGVTGQNYNVSTLEEDLLDVSGYNYSIDINSNSSDTLKYTLGASIAKMYVADREKCYLKIGDDQLVFDVQRKIDSLAKSDLRKYADARNSSSYEVPKEMLRLNKSTANYKVTLAIKSINWVKESGTGKNKIIYIDGAYLIK